MWFVRNRDRAGEILAEIRTADAAGGDLYADIVFPDGVWVDSLTLISLGP